MRRGAATSRRVGSWTVRLAAGAATKIEHSMAATKSANETTVAMILTIFEIFESIDYCSK